MSPATWGAPCGLKTQSFHPHIVYGAVMFEGILQPMHLLVIFLIALLVFGPSKLADLGKGPGEGGRDRYDREGQVARFG